MRIGSGSSLAPEHVPLYLYVMLDVSPSQIGQNNCTIPPITKKELIQLAARPRLSSIGI